VQQQPRPPTRKRRQSRMATSTVQQWCGVNNSSADGIGQLWGAPQESSLRGAGQEEWALRGCGFGTGRDVWDSGRPGDTRRGGGQRGCRGDGGTRRGRGGHRRGGRHPPSAAGTGRGGSARRPPSAPSAARRAGWRWLDCRGRPKVGLGVRAGVQRLLRRRRQGREGRERREHGGRAVQVELILEQFDPRRRP